MFHGITPDDGTSSAYLSDLESFIIAEPLCLPDLISFPQLFYLVDIQKLFLMKGVAL